MIKLLKEFPFYYHVLAVLALLIGIAVGGSSPNFDPLWGSVLCGLLFFIGVYIFPGILILPDLISMLIRYPQHKKDQIEFENYIKQNAKITAYQNEVDKTGRFKCPKCNFRSVVNCNYFVCSKCSEPILIKNET